MSCDVGEVKERLENELCYDYNYELRSFSNLSVTSPTSQLIFQPFRRFTYATPHTPTLPLLYLRHSSFSNPSFASPTSQALHLIHLASRPWKEPSWRASIPGIYRIPSDSSGRSYVTEQWHNVPLLRTRAPNPSLAFPTSLNSPGEAPTI